MLSMYRTTIKRWWWSDTSSGRKWGRRGNPGPDHVWSWITRLSSDMPWKKGHERRWCPDVKREKEQQGWPQGSSLYTRERWCFLWKWWTWHVWNENEKRRCHMISLKCLLDIILELREIWDEHTNSGVINIQTEFRVMRADKNHLRSE